MSRVDVAARKPDVSDVCCFPRRRNDFEPQTPFALTKEDVVELLRLNQTGLISVLVVQSLIMVLWLGADIIPGFVLYNGASGNLSAYTHGFWWRVIELISILIGSASTYFGLDYLGDPGTITRSVARTEQWLVVYIVVLVIAIVSHMIHAILTIFEYANCDSTLCTAHEWVMIMLIFFLILSAVISAWQITRAYTFRENLKQAHALSAIDMNLSESAESEQPAAAAATTTGPNAMIRHHMKFTPAAAAPPIAVSNTTPLLMAMTKNRPATRHGVKIQ